MKRFALSVFFLVFTFHFAFAEAPKQEPSEQKQTPPQTTIKETPQPEVKPTPTPEIADATDAPSSSATTPPDSPMQFSLAGNGGNCPSCQWISAEGEITPETPQNFSNFLDQLKTDNAGAQPLKLTLMIHSDGGDLLAAIALGQAIRQAGYDTNVAHTVVEPNASSSSLQKTEVGLCRGSCVFAFLGGTARSLEQGMLELQTYRPPLEGAGTTSGNEVDVRKQQLIDIAYITDYAHKMGFDPKIAFLNWQNADPHIFTKQEIEQYRLAYDPQLFGPFKLEQKQQGLNSVAKSGDGKSTASLYCTAENKLVIEMTQPTKQSPILKDYFAEAMRNLETANIFGLAIPIKDVDYTVIDQQMVWRFTWPLNNKRSLDLDGNQIATSDVDGPFSKLFEFRFSDIESLKQQLPLIVKNCP